jgi:hypothetical protein
MNLGGAHDPARNAYLPRPDLFLGNCSGIFGCEYDMGDNPIDIGGVIEQVGSIRYADQATYDRNAQPMNHTQLGPNVWDHVSSLIIDNLDVYGGGEPLAYSYGVDQKQLDHPLCLRLGLIV